MSKKQNTSNSNFKKKCQSASWDDLAIQIIQLESQLHSKNKLTTPKNIHKKLEILEEEKSRRVSDCFDIHYFLTCHHIFF